MWWVPHNNGALNSLNSRNSLYYFAQACSRFTFTSLAIGGGCLIGFFVVNGVTDRLHQATIQQCEQQAWPADQHAAHVEFCEAYLADTLATAAIKRGGN